MTFVLKVVAPQSINLPRKCKTSIKKFRLYFFNANYVLWVTRLNSLDLLYCEICVMRYMLPILWLTVHVLYIVTYILWNLRYAFPIMWVTLLWNSCYPLRVSNNSIFSTLKTALHVSRNSTYSIYCQSTWNSLKGRNIQSLAGVR